MNNNKHTICLETTLDKNRINYTWYYRSENNRFREQKKVEKFQIVEQKCYEMIQQLNDDIGNKIKYEQTRELLKNTASYVCDLLFTQSLKKFLRETQAEYLMLYIDKKLMSIPWELFFIDEDMMCEKFFIGRFVFGNKESQNRRKTFPLKMLILSPDKHLLEAKAEGIEICKLAGQLNTLSMTLAADRDLRATSESLKFEFKNYDLVHFAGHADYSENSPENCGWQLNPLNPQEKYSNLTINTIENMAGGAPMPLMIFSNACQSARTGMQLKENQKAFNLANAFCNAGVRHYIGTSWNIIDETGSLFAISFYHYLFSGCSVGESIFKARKELLKEKKSFCWASYQLYGDPRKIYFKHSDLEPKRDKEKDPPIINKKESKPITRGPVDYIRVGFQKIKEKFNLEISKEARNWITISFIMVFMTIAGLTYRDFYYEKNNIERIKMHMKKVKEDKKEIFDLFQKILKENVSIDQKIQYEINVVDTSPIDINIEKRNRNSLIISAIEKNIIDNSLYSPLVNKTAALKKILKDKFILAKKPTNTKPLCITDFNLFVEVLDISTEGTKVIMNLSDSTLSINPLFKTQTKFNPLGKIKDDIKFQDMMKDLIETLNTYKPPKAKVLNIKGKEIQLNIGANYGLKIGQKFEVVNNSRMKIEIISINDSFSKAKILSNKSSLQKGDDIKLILITDLGKTIQKSACFFGCFSW